MVTIIITAYNVSKTIAGAIQSCLNQTYKDLEILIINDSSTDNTLEVIQSIKDPRIRVINNRQNVGAGMSRRIGTKAAKGEYTTFLDGDDWLDKDYVETLYNLAKDNDADVVSSGIRFIDGNNIHEDSIKEHGVYKGFDYIMNINLDNRVTTSYLNTKIVRRDIWDKVDYSDRRYIEDTQTAYYVLFYANKVVATPYIGYNYLQNPNSLCHTADDAKRIIYKALCAKDILSFVQEHKKDHIKYALNSFLYRIKNVKSIQFTDEIISKYNNELAELFVFLLQFTQL